jgi:hypothetical protein
MCRLRSRESLDQPIRRASAPSKDLPEETPVGEASKFLRFQMIANTKCERKLLSVPAKDGEINVECGSPLMLY